MENPWDTRYSQEEYIYGKSPNEYFRQQIEILPIGKLLLPAEGEGRNAVYAARLGWEVLALDMSEMGKQKAIKLANENNVSIQYEICNLENYHYPVNEYDVLAIIYAHFPAKIKEYVYKNLAGTIKKGGTLVLETFSKKQLGKSSGGPQEIGMLNSLDELKGYFEGFEFIEMSELEIELGEGGYHNGLAEIVRIFAKKQDK